ncbi:MAG: HAD family hydrolase [Planctomycetota bacterium]
MHLLNRCLPLVLLCSCAATPQRAVDPGLPSWSDGATKASIVEFVEAVTDPRSRDFVAPEERLAVFDNDGTLWAEQPAYFQLLFAVDRVRALAPEHPEWASTQPFAAAIDGDWAALAEQGTHGLLELVTATHAGMTSEEFDALSAQWLAEARHPQTQRPYTEMVYAPMLELLEYLRAHGFRTCIVSGGGVDFLRAFAQEVYGIPPEQVVGSRLDAEYAEQDGRLVVRKRGEIAFVDDGPGKPIGIERRFGRRPILAVGNSDGDFEMLEWTTAGDGRRLALLVHHDDAEREWAYDRESSIGRLERGLDEADSRGWLVVGMREDWKQVFAPR